MFTNVYSIYLNLAWVYGRSLAGIARSNHAGGMDTSLLNVLYCRVPRADHLSSGVLLSVVCLSVTEKPHRGDLGPLRLSSRENKLLEFYFVN